MLIALCWSEYGEQLACLVSTFQNANWQSAGGRGGPTVGRKRAGRIDLLVLKPC